MRVIRARPATWELIAADPRLGLGEFRAGRLSVRRNLHLGIGFLAATSGRSEPSRLRFETVRTRGARISTIQAGSGRAPDRDPRPRRHEGLVPADRGRTGSALPGDRRSICPGSATPTKPLRAPYDPAYFARAIVDLMDALALERAHLVGNSLGGRVAIELGIEHPERVGRLVLLCPALAWRRERPLVPLLRLTRPELGLVQIAPRPLVEAIVRRVIPGAEQGWTAAGVDEFLRAYLTPAGGPPSTRPRATSISTSRTGRRASGHGSAELQAESLFVWGQRDRLVPIAFARHVEEVLPRARTSSSTAATSPRSSAPAGPIPRSGSSWRRRAPSASTSERTRACSSVAGDPPSVRPLSLGWPSAGSPTLASWGTRSSSTPTTRTAARG